MTRSLRMYGLGRRRWWWRQEQERTMWKRAHLYIFGARVRPCLFLARTLARCPSRPSFHGLAARYRTCPAASLHAARARHAPSDTDLARRWPTRNRPRVCGAGWRRGKRSGSGNGSGRRRGRAAHVSLDASPPAHRIGRVEEEREEGARWWMEMGMGGAHMMCVARLLLTPHPSPVRGGRSVWSHRCSGWGGAASALGTSSSTSVTSLTSLRLLILASGRSSAPSSRRLLIAVGESIPPSTTCSSCDSYGARAAPASPRCGGEDAGYGHGDEDGDGDWAPTSDARMHSIGREPYPHEQLLQTFLWSLACPHLIAYLHSLSDPD
ncbi:hypothetical protein B0H14DRAFT_1325297 [Mycena olivaceomarginata]|nr:hypothetical protein B0H14DRAFT_1325297 [Mycena olivaceomarginata]